MLCSPDTQPKSGGRGLGKSVQHGAPATKFMKERSHMDTRGHLLGTVSGARKCNEPHTCHHYLTAVGFWGCSAFDQPAQIWLPPCKGGRISHSLIKRSEVVVYVICGHNHSTWMSYVSELQFEITKGEQTGKRRSLVTCFAGRKTALSEGFGTQKCNGFTGKFRAWIKWQNNRKCGSTKQLAN